MTSKNPTPTERINKFLSTAPADVRELLTTDAGLHVLLDCASRFGGNPAAERGFQVSPKTRIIAAIRRADLRHREKHNGRPLTELAAYDRLRVKGEDPSRKMIYRRFRSWPHALLASQGDQHIWSSNRRDRGGNRTDVQFSLADCERYALRWAEEVSGGRLPTTGDWQLIVADNPEAPSLSQVQGRKANGKTTRNYTQFIDDCKARAFAEPELWPITALALKWEVVS